MNQYEISIDKIIGAAVIEKLRIHNFTVDTRAKLTLWPTRKTNATRT
jgi:hypothetical protein